MDSALQFHGALTVIISLIWWLRAQALTQPRASLQWSPLVLKTCWDCWQPGMLLLEGRRPCQGLQALQAEGKKSNEPEEEVREGTMTTAEECEIQKRACCDPANNNSKKKNPASILRCHLWLIGLFFGSHVFLLFFPNEWGVPGVWHLWPFLADRNCIHCSCHPLINVIKFMKQFKGNKLYPKDI